MPHLSNNKTPGRQQTRRASEQNGFLISVYLKRQRYIYVLLANIQFQGDYCCTHTNNLP